MSHDRAAGVAGTAHPPRQGHRRGGADAATTRRIARSWLPADDDAGLGAPGWWTSDVPSGQPAHRFRGGHADLGMAHGVSGPLALLALAMRQGITVNGHAAAIDRICTWLDAWRHEAPAGPSTTARRSTGSSIPPSATAGPVCSREAAEQMAVTHLGPLLTDAEDSGSSICWWFVRKGPSWRLRLRSVDGRGETATAVVDRVTTALMDQGAIRRAYQRRAAGVALASVRHRSGAV